MRTSHRIHKRFFVVAGLTLTAVIVAALAIVFSAASLAGSGDLIRFSIREASGASPVLGAGISLVQADSGNLIEDASFEPIVFRQALTILSGDTTTLTVSSAEAGQGLYRDGFFDQASARVLTRSDNGLVLRKSARVVHFGINRVGVFQPVVLPGDMPTDVAFLDFTRQGDLSVGVGEQGLIVRNLSGQVTEVVASPVEADLTGVDANETLMAACSAAGDVLLSDDGGTWHSVPLAERKPLRAIALSSRSVVVAVGDKGHIVAGFADDFITIRPLAPYDLMDVVFGDDLFVAVGRRGVILTSKNGLIWRKVEQNRKDDWLAVDYREGRFVIVGDSGSVLHSDDGELFHPLQDLPGTNGVDVVLLSRQQYIVLDDSGAFIISNDSGQSWQKSGVFTGMDSRVIDLAGKDKVISADDSGLLGLAQLVAEVQLDSALKEGQYQAGDIIFLEKTLLSVSDHAATAGLRADACRSPWRLHGKGSMVRTDEDAGPQGGLASLRLQADTAGQPVILSQQIDPQHLAGMSHNEVLQVSLWLRQEAVQNRQVQVWLSGPFESVGTTLTNVGAGWKKYTYALVVPARPGGYAGQDIRLNIAIESGTLWLDRIFLGRIDESAVLLSARMQGQVQTIQPQIIRFDNLGIGSRSILTENWVWPMHNDNPTITAGCWANQRGASMHAALSLAQGSGAIPWLVIDSYAGEGEILNLIEYLAAPLSEPYGRLRQEQGMFTPWTQQFQRFYIEICDRSDVFGNDRTRSEYVNLIIQTISQSPYFRQVKSQLVFVDGMSYKDGVMLSKADFHASDLDGLLREDRHHTTELSLQTYLDQIPRNPDKPPADFPEMMRTADLRETAMRTARLADFTDLILHDMGRQSGLVNIAMPADWSDRRQAVWQAAATIASTAVQGSPLSVFRITSDLTDGDALVEQDPRASVRAYGFADDRQIAIVLTNLSDETATCQLLSDIPLGQATMDKYDETGQLLGRQQLRSNSSRITILPGGVVVLLKTHPDGQP